jgi:hypothetical protein
MEQALLVGGDKGVFLVNYLHQARKAVFHCLRALST